MITCPSASRRDALGGISSLRLAALVGGAAGALLAAPATRADAEEAIVVQPRASFIVPDKVYPGVGIGVDAGLSLDYEPILVMPELSLVGDGYPSLKGGSFRAMAGVRVGLTLSVIPSVFLHVGYGFLDGEGDLAHFFSLDTGLSLDYRVSRVFTIGGSLGYETLANGKGAVHGAFVAPRFGFWID